MDSARGRLPQRVGFAEIPIHRGIPERVPWPRGCDAGRLAVCSRKLDTPATCLGGEITPTCSTTIDPPAPVPTSCPCQPGELSTASVRPLPRRTIGFSGRPQGLGDLR